MGDFEYIRLAAIAGQDDPLGRAPGEPLWKLRAPVEDDGTGSEPLGSEPGQRGTIRGQIGEFSFGALYQGEPRPRGAKLFGQASYFDPKTLDLTGWRLGIGGDPAGSEKTSADFCGAVVLAMRGWKNECEGRVLEVYRKQKSIPDFTAVLRALQLKWHLAPIYVEAVSGFKAIPQLLRAQDPTLAVHEAPVLGDKFQRAQLASAAWNANPSALLVPLGSPNWLAEFLWEVQRFTGVRDTFDDQVDALSHVWNGLATMVPPPKYEVPANRMKRRV